MQLIAAEFALLFSSLPRKDAQDVREARAASRMYIDAIAGAPLWAVTKARQRIIAGETPYGRPFCPSPVEFGDVVRDIMRVAKNEIIILGGLLTVAERADAPPPRSQLVEDGFDDLKGSFAPREERPRARGAVADASLRERLKALGRDPAELDRLPGARERS